MTAIAKDNNVILHKKRVPLKKLIEANKSQSRLDEIKQKREQIFKGETTIIGLDENGIPITNNKGKKDDIKAASDEKKIYRNGEVIEEVAPLKEETEEISEEKKKLIELEEKNKCQIENDALVKTK